MGELENYKNIISEELEYRAGLSIANSKNIKRHLIVDENRLEFVLLTVGWAANAYHHGVVFHIEIKDNKVFVHQDNTDVGIAAVFADQGIPKSDIVLGFLPKYAQELSGYAVA